MTQNRINQERTDHLDLLDVANAFISGFEHMMYTFGVFKVLDRACGLYITSTCLVTYRALRLTTKVNSGRRTTLIK